MTDGAIAGVLRVFNTIEVAKVNKSNKCCRASAKLQKHLFFAVDDVTLVLCTLCLVQNS